MIMLYVQKSRMDAAGVQSARADFDVLAAANQNVTFDMTNVDFMDSPGVGALVYVFKRVRARGHNIAVINLNGQPKQLFEDLRLSRVFRD